MFTAWEPSDNKGKMIEFLIHGGDKKDGTLIMLAEDTQNTLSSFLNKDGIIDEDSEEANAYLETLSEEYLKYF